MSTVTEPAVNQANGSSMVPATPIQQQPVQLMTHQPADLMMRKTEFEQMQRIAIAMGKGSLCPKHLQGNTPEATAANCLRVVNQAARWDMDPFAVADESYVVGGRLAYQGKLVAAVVNARAGLKGGLRPLYNSGNGDALAVVVYGSKEDVPAEAFELLQEYVDSESREAFNKLSMMGVLAVRVSVEQAKTKNDIWTKDPEQKLFYSGAIKWARRHKPEVIMGVLTEDDAAMIMERESSPRMVAPTSLNDVASQFIPPPQEAENPSATEGGHNNDSQPPADPPAAEPAAAPAPEQPPARGPSPLQSAIELVQASRTLDELNQIYNRYVGPSSKLKQAEIDQVSEACSKRKEQLVDAAANQQTSKPAERDWLKEIDAAEKLEAKQAVLAEMEKQSDSIDPEVMKQAKHKIDLAKW